MPGSVLRAAVIVSTACAVVATATIVKREIRPGIGRPRPVSVPGALWDSLLTTGHWIGPRRAPVVLVEFGDFECPACGAFARVIESVQRANPSGLALVYHHLPIPYHERATTLAHGAECAAEQGAFARYYSYLFRNQSAAVRMPVVELAVRSGVPDTARHGRCMSSSTEGCIASKWTPRS